MRAAIWFYSDQGLLRYHDGKMNFYRGVISPELSRFALKIDVPSKSGGFWRILNGTVQKWRDNRVEENCGPCPWDQTIVAAACEDKDGHLIVGTLGAGIFRSDAAGKWQNISTNQGLSSVYVLSLCVDREGDLWVGTDGGGLDRIKRKNFSLAGGTSPVGRAIVVGRCRRRFVGGLRRAGRRLLEHEIPVQDFHVGPLQDAWEVLVDHNSRSGPARATTGFFNFKTAGLFPRPAR